MPTNTLYNQEYYRTHKAAIRAQQAAWRAQLRTDPTVTSRGAWLRARLTRHSLKQTELAALLGLHKWHVSHWLLPVTSAR